MDDLIVWLNAQLDEDERLANAAAKYGPDWRYSVDGEGIYPSDEARHPGPIISGTYGGMDEEYGEHVAHNDPARVLREVAAKRLLIGQHPVGDDLFCWDGIGLIGCKWAWPCPSVRLLALPYADRPGYRDEWRLVA